MCIRDRCRAGSAGVSGCDKWICIFTAYRLYWNDVQLFASMDVSELFVGEAQEAFREYVMQDDTLPRFMQEQLDAIRVIQELSLIHI